MSKKDNENDSMKDRFKLYFILVCILGLILGGIVIYNSCQLKKRASENNEETEKIFSIINASSMFTISSDSLGRAYIDSIRIYPKEILSVIESQAVDKLTDYNKSIAETASSASNTMILWATLLTLLSIMFTFLGLIELKDRLKKVEQGIKELEKKKRDVSKMQTKVQNQSDEIDLKVIEIRKETRLIQFNSELQSLLLFNRLEETLKTKLISEFYALIDKIQEDNILTNEDRKTIICRVYYCSMDIWRKEGEYEKAIEDGEKVLSIDVNNPETYYHMGNIYDSKGDHENAEFYYNKAIKINPLYNIALLNRAFLYKDMGDKSPEKKVDYYAKCIADMETIVANSPDNIASNRLNTLIRDLRDSINS